jgi:hypothetical protein
MALDPKCYAECHLCCMSFMLSVANKRAMLKNAECRCAECHHAECRYAECHYAECHCAECHYAACRCAECRYAECCCAEHRYAECHRLARYAVFELSVFTMNVVVSLC